MTVSDTTVRDASGPVPEHVEPTLTHLEGRELPDEDILVAPPRRIRFPERALYLILGLGLFVVALGLMKEGSNFVPRGPLPASQPAT